MSELDCLIAQLGVPVNGIVGLNKVTAPILDKMRAIEIECQWHLTCDFLDVIEELYPDEFEEAYEEYQRRSKG